MTDKLPPNLLALFAPRPPLRWVPPPDHAPEDRKTAPITGVAAFLPQLKEEFGDYTPTESWLEAKDRKILEKQAHQKYITGDGFKSLYTPNDDAQIRGDPFKTLFVGRLSYDTEIKDLEREFGRFGPIDRVRIVTDNGESDQAPNRVNKKSRKGKSKGYAFVVFEREQDMKGAHYLV
jgi:U1 small nuclear ribonucleoprotein 70kDa